MKKSERVQLLRDDNVIGWNELRGSTNSVLNLKGVSLTRNELNNIFLNNTNLERAWFVECNLNGAWFDRANCHRISFVDCSIKNARFYCTNLKYAQFIDCDLSHSAFFGANLFNAVIRRCNLTDIKYNHNTIGLQPAPEGDLIVYKLLLSNLGSHDGTTIWELLIPKEAKRSCGTGRKHRAEFAKVIRCVSHPDILEGHSVFRASCVYRVGKTIYPDSWDDDRWNECSNGIHFFLSRQEAEEYQ